MNPKHQFPAVIFFEFLRSRAKEFGRPIGAEYGEGFTAERYIGAKSFFDLV